MTAYTCARCCAPARVAAGGIVRTCACVAGLTAHLRAHATGEGGACAPRPSLGASIGRAFVAVLAAFRRA